MKKEGNDAKDLKQELTGIKKEISKMKEKVNAIAKKLDIPDA